MGRCLFSDLSFLEKNFFHWQGKKIFSWLFTPKEIVNVHIKHLNTTGSFCSHLHPLNLIISCSALITYRQTPSLDLADPAVRTLINSCDHDAEEDASHCIAARSAVGAECVFSELSVRLRWLSGRLNTDAVSNSVKQRCIFIFFYSLSISRRIVKLRYLIKSPV